VQSDPARSAPGSVGLTTDTLRSCRARLRDHPRLGDRHDELAARGAERPLLRHDLLGEVPRQDQQVIGSVVGEPATFRFFSAATRKQDAPGAVLDAWTPDDLTETDSLEANLPSAKNAEDGWVPVRFQSRLTELGVFELWCLSQSADQKWKLEFSVRQDAEK
jgi:hypothetical protein